MYVSYLSGVGYAVVKTSPPPSNMLVGKKWLCGYAVVETTPPPQNILVRKKVAKPKQNIPAFDFMILAGSCV